MTDDTTDVATTGAAIANPSNVDTLAATMISTIAAGAATVSDVKAADGSTSKVETAVSDVAQIGSGMLETLGNLHILDAALVEKGTSVAELIAAVAKAFLGIHL